MAYDEEPTISIMRFTESGRLTAESQSGSWLLQKSVYQCVYTCVEAPRCQRQIIDFCGSFQINKLFILTMTHLHGAHSKLAPHLRSQRKRKTPEMTRRRGSSARPLRGARWSCSWRCSLGHGGPLRTENKRRSQKVSQRVLYHVTRTTVCSHSLSQLQLLSEPAEKFFIGLACELINQM